MPPAQHPRIAVIADAHFHDLYADYGFPGIVEGGRRLTFRLFADTARSTRVFNESYAALCHTLDRIAKEGIRHVVLLGDYSDDGQLETVKGVKRILDDYAGRFGMRFYATVGNHDIFGATGRHRAKRFLNEDGSYSVLASDPHVRDRGARSVIEAGSMYCSGYPEGLLDMAAFGFYPQAGDIHWETPFGREGDPQARLYSVHSRDGRTTRVLMDASYLIEPFPGVWLMMIDANVFVPVNGVRPGDPGDLADSTSAGWNAMLDHKPFVFRWMTDVSARARAQGKCLIAFSHYPVLDPLDETRDDEVALLGRTGMVERLPRQAVARALLDAGIGLHFSGHLHVNDTARYQHGDRALINVAVPSLVAFPAAYKIITVEETQIGIETVRIGDMRLDPDVRRAYEREIAPSRLEADPMLTAADYGCFLSEHIAHLVGRRYLKREWPKDIGAMIRGFSLFDLAILALIEQPVASADAIARVATARADAGVERRLAEAGVESAAIASLSAMDLLIDWYRLRMGSELALDWIDAERLSVYRAVGGLYLAGHWRDKDAAQSLFRLIFRMFEKYLSGLPSDTFSIDREKATISHITAQPQKAAVAG